MAKECAGKRCEWFLGRSRLQLLRVLKPAYGEAHCRKDGGVLLNWISRMSYLISLGVGFVVGLAYWLLKVQSPAPPLIALAGLLGMVLGEHAIPVVKAQLFAQTSAVQVAWPTKDLVEKPDAKKTGD